MSSDDHVDDPTSDEIRVTGDNLRGLVHPLRVKVLGLLRMYGPATASSLASQLGLTSGALSYHLRQLAKYGFIVEDDSRGNRRERWWKSAHRNTAFDPVELGSAVGGAAAFENMLVASSVDRLLKAESARKQDPAEWQQVFEVSDILLRLRPNEVRNLSQDLLALLRSYPPNVPGDPEPEGSRAVAVQFQIFPLPDRTPGLQEQP